MEIKDLYMLSYEQSKELNKQRTSYFNFFIVLSALIINATVSTFKEGLFIFAIILSILQFLLAILFALLDKRNCEYIKCNIDLAIMYEEELKKSKNLDLEFLFINMRATYKTLKKSKFKVSTTFVYNLIYSMFFLLGVGTLVLSILSLS